MSDLQEPVSIGLNSPNAQVRFAADLRYAYSPAVTLAIPKSQSFEMDYYGLKISIPALPVEWKMLSELTTGLMAAFDDQYTVKGVVDCVRKVDALTFTESTGIHTSPQDSAPQVINFSLAANSHEEQVKLKRLFEDEGIKLPDEAIQEAVIFLSDYYNYGSFLARKMGQRLDPKVLEFKPLYQSWLYNKFLYDRTDAAGQLLYHSLFGRVPAAALCLTSGDLSNTELVDLVQNSHELLSYTRNPELIENLFEKFALTYVDMAENVWETNTFAKLFGQKPEQESFQAFMKEFNNEQVNYLVRSFAFMVENLSNIHSDPEFMSKLGLFETLLDSMAKISQFQADASSVKLPPNIFDDLTTLTSAKGRDQIRSVVHKLFTLSGRTLQGTQAFQLEREKFYEAFSIAMGQEQIKPEETTGDTEIEWGRFKEIIKRTSPKKVLEIGIGTGRIAKLIRAEFPDIELYGIDIQPPEVLFPNGPPSDIHVAQLNVADLNKNTLGEKFKIDKVDLVIAPWSVYGDLTDEELVQTLQNQREIAQATAFDVPLVVENQGSYLDKMSASPLPQTLRVPFGNGIEKDFNLRSPERYIEFCSKAGIKVENIPDDNNGREEFLTRLRTDTLLRTADVYHSPHWITANNKPRITFVGHYM